MALIPQWLTRYVVDTLNCIWAVIISIQIAPVNGPPVLKPLSLPLFPQGSAVEKQTF